MTSAYFAGCYRFAKNFVEPLRPIANTKLRLHQSGISSSHWVANCRPFDLRMVLAALLVFAISTSYADTESIRFQVDSFEVLGSNPINESKTNKILSSYTGRKIVLEELRQASAALEEEIQKAGYPFYRVVIPAQSLIEGNVQLNVIAFNVGKVEINGNKIHSDENIRRSIPSLQEGTSPNTAALRRQLAISNLNPSKETQVFFATEDDAELISRVTVHEQKPQNLLAWINDTGSEDTGENRIGFAYQNSNLFDRDHVFTGSFTTSLQESDDVQVYSASYQAPVYPLGGMLTVYAVRSEVDSGAVATFFDVSGKGDFYGADFTWALPNFKRMKQFFSVGIDDKEFDNDIDFEGQPIGIDVRSRPVWVRHKGEWEKDNVQISTYTGIYSNLESGDLNDDISYALTRSGATPDWSSIKIGGLLNISFGDWDVRSRASAQLTSDALIPGEQFGVGGAASVRGLDERQLVGDEGLFLSIETLSPALGNEEGPRVGVFADYGYVSNNETLPGDLTSESVVSIGTGIRWQWKKKLSLKIDYGYVIDGTSEGVVGEAEDGDSRIHFQLLGRF